jgi:hypothetical protein
MTDQIPPAPAAQDDAVPGAPAAADEALPTTERVYADPGFDQGYMDALNAARRAGDPDWLDAAPHTVEEIVEVQGVEAVLDENDQQTGEQRVVTRRVRASLVPEYTRSFNDYQRQQAEQKGSLQ